MPPLIVWALGAVGAIALARLIAKQARRIGAQLNPQPPATRAAEALAFNHPRPAITHDNAFFWQGLTQRKLLFQAFQGRLRHPPAPMDPVTGALDFEIVEASGRGTIHSFVVMHQPKMPGFNYPLPIVLVELEEGVRIVANMLDAKPEEVANLICYLCSKASSATNGAALRVDGGIVTNPF